MIAASAAQDGWVTITVLVTVKAYPSISQTYDEVACIAGVRLDTAIPEWVRLFPVRFRELPRHQQFKKYEVIRLLAKRGRTDRRRETWKPNVDSIKRGPFIPAGGHWPLRRRLVEPLIGPTMCELRRGRRDGRPGASPGVVRPARVLDVRVRPSEEWSPGQQAVLNQGSLLVDKHRRTLEKPDHAFLYDWVCEEPGCNGHRQTIVDWEIGESYRSWRRAGYDPVTAVRARWLGDICSDDRETMFFVGDQHQRPGSFLVLGAFYPRFAPAQLPLELLGA